jgi:hypothetical protein
LPWRLISGWDRPKQAFQDAFPSGGIGFFLTVSYQGDSALWFPKCACPNGSDAGFHWHEKRREKVNDINGLPAPFWDVPAPGPGCRVGLNLL